MRTKLATKMVLSDDPQRIRLRTLQAALEARRDAIAELDLEIETAREQLTTFEAFYHGQMHAPHTALKRAEALLLHFERWIEALQQRAAVAAEAQRIEQRRAREVLHHLPAVGKKADNKKRQSADAAPLASPTWTPPLDKKEQLKAVYRELARRFHPDLARDEATQVRNSQIMARINLLYREGELDGLLALREQAKGGDIEDPDVDVEAQIAALTRRLTWFETVLKNLQEEHVALEQSATRALWRNMEQEHAEGRDFFATLRGQAKERLQRAYGDVPASARDLEAAVARYNRQQTPKTLQKRTAGQALEQVFDPYADKSLVRLGLDDLSARGASSAVRQRAVELEALAHEDVGLLRLVLFAAVSELSAQPLAGLETYADLALRYQTLARTDDAAVAEDTPSLGEALVRTDAWLEYGVKRATDTMAHTGLRFRAEDVRRAVPLALRGARVRREFKRVLQVLGEHTVCTGCAEKIFAVPLYRLRGLDDLRACVCPLCSETLSKYWMPKGKDVQAVLNATFVDYEIISEWSFSLARASIATQLVPKQVATMTLGALKKQVIADVFERYDMEISAKHVVLTEKNKEIADRTPLSKLDVTRFRMQFRGDAPMSEADALEVVRHRIRNRFS